MSREMIVDRIEKVGKGYVVACECDEDMVMLRVTKLNGAKEGDIISYENKSIKVLVEKTRKRREEIIALQNSFGKKEC